MIVTPQNMSLFFGGVSMSFNKGQTLAPSKWDQVAMKIPSSGRDNTYGWLADMPRMREWVGARIVHELSSHGYALLNRAFELTLAVKRDDIEDDRYGIYAPKFEQLGRDVKVFPDELIFGLLASGFVAKCFDDQPFFSATHPVEQAGMPATASNVQLADAANPAGPAAWYLLDCSQPIRPLIFQERRPFELVARTQPEDPHVFENREFLYGTDGRCNAGFGLWQLAAASQLPLTPANYAALRAGMMEQVGETGRPLGVMPTHLVVPPQVEGPARALMKNELNSRANGDGTYTTVSNEWAGSAELLVTQYLGAASAAYYRFGPDGVGTAPITFGAP